MTTTSPTLVAGLPTSVNLRAVDERIRGIIADLLSGKVEQTAVAFIRDLCNGTVALPTVAKPRRTRSKATADAAPVDLPELTAPGIVFASAKALMRQVEQVAFVVEKRTTIPILMNLKIEATPDGSCTITGTDLEVAVVAEAQASAVMLPPPVFQVGYRLDADGYYWQSVRASATTVVLTLPAHSLLQLLKKMGDVPVTLGAAGNVQAGAMRGELPVLPADEFPVMAFEATGHIRLPAAELGDIFGAVAFAISTEETRYYLNGIYLHVPDPREHSRLCAVATDGHRLGLRRFTPDAQMLPGEFVEHGVIIPRKSVAAIRRLCAAAMDGSLVALRFGTALKGKAAAQLSAHLPDGIVHLTTRLVDGTFPDYQRVIPTCGDKTWTVESKAFARAVQKVAVVSTDRSRAVKLSIGGAEIAMSCVSPEGGRMADTVACESNMASGEGLEIGCNARYLLDIAAQADRLTFCATDAASPVVVTDPDSDRCLFVQMPLRV